MTDRTFTEIIANYGDGFDMDCGTAHEAHWTTEDLLKLISAAEKELERRGCRGEQLDKHCC
jgi:hypothetical protein